MDVFQLSKPGGNPVEIGGVMPATTEEVYRAWTEPDELMQWFGPPESRLYGASVDLRVGGRYRFDLSAAGDRGSRFEGEYLEIDPGVKVSFDWVHVTVSDDGVEERSPQSIVTVTFEPHAGGTFVRIVHKDVKSQSSRHGVAYGWNASLERLFGVLSSQLEARA